MLACSPANAQTSIASAMLARARGGTVTTDDAVASDLAVQPPATLEAALRTAFAGAGVIFAGEVVSIDRTAGAVLVRWHVEEAVRGVNAGAVYEQKEWAGLWGDGNARYCVGERALVLLHAPSVAGYASPAGDGVVPLRGDTITGTLDLRWLSQQVAVTDSARLRPMMALQAAGGNIAFSDALLRRAARTAAVARAGSLLSPPAREDGGTNGSVAVAVSTATGALAKDANARVDGAMILGMLHAWQRAETAAK